MARRQLQIAGTERTEIPAIEKAAEAFREACVEHAEASKVRTRKKIELLLVMASEKVKLHRYHDENGEEIEVKLEDEPTVKLRKTGEAESDIGDGVPSNSNGVASDSVPSGLIAQAMKDQQDAGVEVDGEGDVIVPDEAAPKKGKRKGKKS